jgi:hypothetical protein
MYAFFFNTSIRMNGFKKGKNKLLKFKMFSIILKCLQNDGKMIKTTSCYVSAGDILRTQAQLLATVDLSGKTMST